MKGLLLKLLIIWRTLLKLVLISLMLTLAVMITGGFHIRRRVCRQDVILKLNLILNTFLNGLDLDEINMNVIQKMREQSEGYEILISEILDAVAKAISEEESVRVYTSGATNILKYPELSDMQKASDLLYALEEKKELSEFIKGDGGENETGIQVYIGKETPMEVMQDCSVSGTSIGTADKKGVTEEP